MGRVHQRLVADEESGLKEERKRAGKKQGSNRLVKENLWKRGDQLPVPRSKVSFIDYFTPVKRCL